LLRDDNPTSFVVRSCGNRSHRSSIQVIGGSEKVAGGIKHFYFNSVLFWRPISDGPKPTRRVGAAAGGIDNQVGQLRMHRRLSTQFNSGNASIVGRRDQALDLTAIPEVNVRNATHPLANDSF